MMFFDGIHYHLSLIFKICVYGGLLEVLLFVIGCSGMALMVGWSTASVTGGLLCVQVFFCIQVRLGFLHVLALCSLQNHVAPSSLASGLASGHSCCRAPFVWCRIFLIFVLAAGQKCTTGLD